MYSISLNVFLNTRSSDLELPVAIQHREEAEVHRAHVERGDLGLELQRRLQPLLDGHRRRTAGREVEHHVTAALDIGRELAEVPGILRRVAVDRIACMQVDDRRTGLGGADRGVGDLLWRDREVRRHRRRVDAARHRAGDDDFARLCHRETPSSERATLPSARRAVKSRPDVVRAARRGLDSA